jgi:hypothetical protein
MVAEAVKVSGWTADELTSGDGRKLVIGSGAVGMMDSIEEDGGDGAVKEDGSDTTIKEDGGEVTPKEDGKKDDDKDLMG